MYSNPEQNEPFYPQQVNPQPVYTVITTPLAYDYSPKQVEW
jgi:hypothetical protein